MARRKKAPHQDGNPPWIMTYTDVMTLLLAFFVLLVSMSTIDKRRKLEALGSVSTAFNVLGFENAFSPLTSKHKKSNKTAGPMEDVEDLADIHDILMEDENLDLDFQFNKNTQILLLNQDMLFKKGETTLSEPGKNLLRRMAPYLAQVNYPLLLAGHTATERDELGVNYEVGRDPSLASPTWMISLDRINAIYRFLVSVGIPEGKLAVEAFGQYRPRHNNQSPEGRQKNRRVDIVLDKRNQDWIDKVKGLKITGPVQDTFNFRDFQFKLDTPQATQPLNPIPQATQQ